MADIKIADIETNNGLLREVRTLRVGWVEFVAIEIGFADYFTAGKRIRPLVLKLEADFGSIDTSQPMQASFHDPLGKIMGGLAVYNPIFIRDGHIDLYCQEKDNHPAVKKLTTDWIKPGRTIKLQGALLARHRTEDSDVAVPQLF